MGLRASAGSASEALAGLQRPLGWPAAAAPSALRHLPRDARDTLFLLAVIGWTMLPHFAHLPAWCAALAIAVLLWRARIALAGGALPSRWVLVAVLALAAALTWWSHRALLGREPGITLIVVLMALKTLELRARRDAFVVFFLGFFLVLTNFLYSQSMATAAAMIVSVWGMLTALVLAHMPVGQPSLRQAAWLAARTAAFGAPLMVLLFVLFPRIGPLWGMPGDDIGTTGLSDRMTMGSVAEIAQDDRIALRLRFVGPGPEPAPQSLYLRGPVLGLFDGRMWQPLTRLPGTTRVALREARSALDYEMTLEPLRLAAVPTLEATPSAPEIEGLRLTTRDDLLWIADRALVERVRFTARAYRSFRYGPTAAEPRLYAMLPPGLNPRTLAWADALRRDPRYARADADVLAAAVLDHIARGGYSYTLVPGTYEGPNAIDEFWLDRKAGFCEHFAAAFVVVMRALDVPARVVTGFQGADPVPVDGYWIVRQSAAHAWAEYWQAGVGWVRADPTAAVSPQRIRSGRRLAPPPGLVESALAEVDPSLLPRLRDAWEAVNNRWNQWVLQYARNRQIELLKDFGLRSPTWEDMALLLIGALSLLAVGGALWAWWDRHRVDPWVRQMRRLRETLAGVGVASAAHDPPGRLAARVREQLGEAGAPLAELLTRLEAQRYGRQARARPDKGLTIAFVGAARRLQRGGAG